MEFNLIKQRETKIDNLLSNLVKVADGVNIIGDGKKAVREAESLETIDEFTEVVYMRRIDDVSYKHLLAHENYIHLV